MLAGVIQQFLIIKSNYNCHFPICSKKLDFHGGKRKRMLWSVEEEDMLKVPSLLVDIRMSWAWHL